MKNKNERGWNEVATLTMQEEKKASPAVAFAVLTIGELLSRGDETSTLSSSCTSPYILPKRNRNGYN